VHGFVINPGYLGKQCNIVANAQPHTGKKHVLNIDLQDFFPGISAWQVKEVFRSEFFGFDEQIANAIALITTYKGQLPTGAPSSPVISNFVCYELDKDLINFSETKSLSYSRYADDLTFSSDSLISDDTVLDIIGLINKNNFRINEKKLRLRTSNSRQTVTGITVNEKVNVNRRLLKKIRAMLHDLNINGLEAATRKHFEIKGECDPDAKRFFVRRLRGYINFVGQVRGKEDGLYLRFKEGITSLKLIS
jgi:RNA-directed DNA polymerase